MSRFVWIWTSANQSAFNEARAAYRRALRGFVIACIGFTIAFGTFLYVLIDKLT